MSYIRKLIGSDEVKVSGIRRFWHDAMLVLVSVATQAMGDQVQTQAILKGTIMN
jgi:hypothetical protein